MTREGIKKRIAGDPEAERITSKHNDFIIDKVFDYFEQCIAELEQQNKALIEERANMQNTHRSTISSLEQHIAELESPKTCYGCRFTTDGRHNCTHWSSNDEDCCSRYTDLIDYYEPKQ